MFTVQQTNKSMAALCQLAQENGVFIYTQMEIDWLSRADRILTAANEVFSYLLLTRFAGNHE
jgi:hypothetical protein